MSAAAGDAARMQASAPDGMAASVAHRAEQRTWICLSLAFLVWCGIAATGLVTVNNYRRYATDSPPAVLAIDRGTVFYEGAADSPQVRARPGMTVEEGGLIEVGEASGASLELFDGSWVKLQPGSRLELATLRVGKFNADHTRLSINLHHGAANLNVAGRLPFSREVTVATPHGVVSLSKGDYLIWVQDDGTRVFSYSGRAKVEADGNVERLRDGERISVLQDGYPTKSPLAENLVRNGDFSRGFPGWQMLDKMEERRADIGGTRRLVEETIAGRKVQALRISRETAKDTHNETGISQDIKRDVSAYRTVSLTAWVKVESASLSGGGYLGSEYPIMFRVEFTDEKSGKTGWSHGFFYANPDNRPTEGGELIARGQWFPYLGRLSDLPNRPAVINRIEVLSAGHDYDALVADVRLIAE